MNLMVKLRLDGGATMLQFKGLNRGFFHDRFSLQESIVGSSRVYEYSIKRDVLARTNSTFTLDKAPMSVDEGDVFSLYDQFGKAIYQGVIIRIEKNIIECSQMMSLFNDNYLYNISNLATIEQTIANLINSQFKVNADPLIEEVFNKFLVTYVAGNSSTLASQKPDYVVNLEDFFYSMFDKYDVRLFFDVPFGVSTPTIQVKQVNLPKLKLIDNTVYLPAFAPVTEVYETNKIIVYATEANNYAYRETWYASKNGITNNANELTRLAEIKTNIIFSDDDISIIKAQNLRNQMYNHKISVDMILNNRLYDFWAMELGQKMEIWYNGDFYDTILTGYELEKADGESLDTVRLIFGKVRTKASQRWNI